MFLLPLANVTGKIIHGVFFTPQPSRNESRPLIPPCTVIATSLHESNDTTEAGTAVALQAVDSLSWRVFRDHRVNLQTLCFPLSGCNRSDTSPTATHARHKRKLVFASPDLLPHCEVSDAITIAQSCWLHQRQSERGAIADNAVGTSTNKGIKWPTSLSPTVMRGVMQFEGCFLAPV